MFEKQFWEAIVTGSKVQTIRRTRKKPINYYGQMLSLRGWEGVAYRSKQAIVCEEKCIDCRPIWIDGGGIVIDGHDRIDEPEELDLFAQLDGFANWEAMQGYDNLCKQLPFSGDFIQWGPNKLLASKYVH